MRVSWLMLFCGMFMTSVVVARDLFVNNLSGNDTVNGRAPASAGSGVGPVKTLAKAMRLAEPGDRVHLANTGEPYREMVTLQGGKNSGTHGDLPFIIEGHGAVIEGTTPIADNAWESLGGGVFRAATYIKSHQVLFLKNGDGELQPATRVRLDSSTADRPKLEPGEYFVWDGYVYFRVDADKTPSAYEPAVAGMTTGLTLYDVHNVILKDLVIRGFAFDGVNAPDNVTNVRLQNVVCRDNGRSGFAIGGAARLTLDRCEAKSNHSAQLRIEGYAEVTLADCKFDPQSAPAVFNDGGVIHTKSVK